jgi:hypothetical protein
MRRVKATKHRDSSVIGVRFVLLLLICVSLLPVLSAGCLESREMTVKVSCGGYWSGTMKTDGESERISSTGSKTYTVSCYSLKVSVGSLSIAPSYGGSYGGSYGSSHGSSYDSSYGSSYGSYYPSGPSSLRSISVTILDADGEELAKDSSGSSSAEVSVGTPLADPGILVACTCGSVLMLVLFLFSMEHVSNKKAQTRARTRYQTRPRQHHQPQRSTSAPTKLPGGYELIPKELDDIPLSEPLYLKGGGYYDTRMMCRATPAKLESGSGNTLIRKQRGLELVELKWKTSSSDEKIRAVVSWEHQKIQETAPLPLLSAPKEEAEDARLCEACSSLVLKSSKFCWYCGHRLAWKST